MESQNQSPDLKQNVAEEPSVVVRLKINEAPEILVTDLNVLQDIIGSEEDAWDED